MNYKLEKISFPSTDGINTVKGYIYTPKDKRVNGILQLAHGMIDHVGRYEALAEHLTARGYILAGNDHLGHGATARAEDLGFFAEKDGFKYVVEDVYRMNMELHERFPDLPVVLMGHSMGSFVARLYAVEHPLTVSGLIIHGTSGPNPLLPMGRAVSALVRLIRGPRHRSELIRSLAFGSYNKKFPKEEGPDAWLTRDAARVADRSTDPYTSYTFTVAGYQDLFRMITECNRESWFEKYPKRLPTLVVSGDCDPVGNYGKGPEHVYRHLLMQGVDTVTLKVYEGARHELFNEINSEEVFDYLCSWLEECGL